MKKKKVYFLWVDDERSINMDAVFCAADYVNFVRLTSFPSAKEFLTNIMREDPQPKIFISLDHDLGGKFTGYDLAKFIVEHKIPLAGFNVHSMNPVGRKNIREIY